ncbi:MAG: glycosyltransferase family 2 protein [Zoogloeaceae bacterium]|nr:glycosyltransferase family 2 protein [Zoogloeaceae bacterium]
MNRVFVLLPVHNRLATTARFVQMLKVQVHQAFQLVLLDDGSRDGTAEAVAQILVGDQLHVISGDGNWWWAGALQAGLNWLEAVPLHPGDVVLIINDDVEIAPDFIETGVRVLMAHPDAVVLARLRDPRSGAVSESGVHVDFRRWILATAKEGEPVNCGSTRGLFLRRTDLGRIGGFRPRWLPHYLSDYEFTMRAHRRGLDILTVPEVVLVPDYETTGLRAIPSNLSWLAALRELFSKRSSGNPVYWTNFLLLTCPGRFLVKNLLRVWWGALLSLHRRRAA